MKILFFLIFSFIFAKDQSWDEMLLYNASFGGVDVATATLKSKKFKNIQNQDILRIEFKAKSKPSLRYIFPINDKIIIEILIENINLSPGINSIIFISENSININPKTIYKTMSSETILEKEFQISLVFHSISLET